MLQNILNDLLRLSVIIGAPLLVKIFLRLGAYVNYSNSKYGLSSFLMSLVMQRRNVGVIKIHDKYSINPAVIAIFMGHTNTLKTLINNDGFNHFYQSDEGLTYVMYAAAFGREEILGMLIKSDCEIYKEGMFGDTAIKLVRRQRLRNLYTENLISAYKLTELQLLRSGVT